MIDINFIMNTFAIYLAICWASTIYIAFFVYDEHGFTSGGYNRRGMDKYGQIKSNRYNDDDYDVNTDTPTFDDNGIEVINKYANVKYSRIEHVPEMLPLMTLILVIAYLI